ncbi:class I SAM-dependent methyltransferase [Bailinhaonella thermotolerans]|uniref:Class I SAM-dependent methyltransferase n=1 Tax=Bailinhaonella thermotolerans TaxID=1070861 RepID=A0A3A4BAR2_9ACTN|nr:class I SAM-dependent methyltransferase [Bailinhaonella thermotolerans]RJL31288.1 class I SAM-dependent methyltransferase [Bailinhaonella thermotolerans]
MEREKVDLTGAPETMLATLYGRALDFRAPDPILGDAAADEAVRRIEYDWKRTGMNATQAAGVALRARRLDEWTAEFLAEEPSATVLHLACGLDSRVLRLAPPPSVRWFDVDYPEVLELRERLLPRPAGSYRTVGASVTEDGWMEEIPADRPVVAVFEGLTMYLREEDGKRLIRRVVSDFPGGRLLFDCYGTLGIRLQKLVPAVRNSGATLHWGIDHPRDLESLHPGLTLLDDLRSVDMPGVERLPRAGRLQMRVLAHLPGFRDIGRILRYGF